jgi:CDGSH-type Zn-finger protein
VSGAPDSPAGTLDVVVDPHGPLRLRGAIELRRKDGTLLDRTDGVALCRCGHSAAKPRCDGTHRTIAWQPDATPGTADTTPGGAPTRVIIRPNGPLVVEGPVCVRSMDGPELARGTRVVLCRCGQSLTKPFCDGSHKRAGFVAD